MKAVRIADGNSLNEHRKEFGATGTVIRDNADAASGNFISANRRNNASDNNLVPSQTAHEFFDDGAWLISDHEQTRFAQNAINEFISHDAFVLATSNGTALRLPKNLSLHPNPSTLIGVAAEKSPRRCDSHLKQGLGKRRRLRNALRCGIGGVSDE